MGVKLSSFTDRVSRAMKLNLYIRIWFPMIFILAGLMSGCINSKKVSYFNDLGTTKISSNTPIPETVIQKNDILNITVSSLDPTGKAVEVFNAPNVLTVNIMGTSGEVIGYLVGTDGTIDFPVLGSIKAEGLTKEQLRQALVKKLTDQDLVKGPIVNIRFLNFRVTVLGEVKNPTVVNVPSEKISLLEAIGLAGDLTIYARRDNILVIRETGNGQKDIQRINLNSIELLSSPYYYLKSNDIIYVEPNKSKIASSGRGQQWIPALLTALSIVAITVTTIVNNNH